MTDARLADYLEHIQQAASDACRFVEGLNKDDFLADKRTQQAVVLSLVIFGEAATKITERHADVVAAHAEVPWHKMRGMRNRIAHGYFDINLSIVWDTVQLALPDLLGALRRLRGDSFQS